MYSRDTVRGNSREGGGVRDLPQNVEVVDLLAAAAQAQRARALRLVGRRAGAGCVTRRARQASFAHSFWRVGAREGRASRPGARASARTRASTARTSAAVPARRLLARNLRTAPPARRRPPPASQPERERCQQQQQHKQ